MLKILVKVEESPIHGKGLFTDENIPKGKIVWIYTDGHDIKISPKEFNNLPKITQKKLEEIGYLSPWSKQWVYPPKNDPAQYTNHSKDNNLKAKFDENVSTEPYFIANRDIKKGEELTNNYYEFDSLTKNTMPTWAT
jgi:SET domain-containing protein